jgi:NADH dehydrogenase
MTPRVVTVFGGAGFVGRHVVRRLAKQGWIIRVAGRDPERAKFLGPLGDVGQITPIAVALQRPDSIAAAVVGADAVINLVGILYERGRQNFKAVHVDGPKFIAEAAAATGVKSLVHVSAIGADMTAKSDYARSKGYGEQVVRAAFPDAVICRPSLVIGPEDGFFNRFGMLARLMPWLPLIGGGKTRFQPVYVGDLAEAISRALTDPKARGASFEFGGPKVYTFKELMQLLLSQIHRRRLLIPVPFWVAELQAGFLELMPVPLLTRDNVLLLKQDNVVSQEMPGFADLDITPTAIEMVIPSYLDRYRPGGRASRLRAA